TLVAADLDLAADVGLHFAAQIAFHLEVLFDVIAQLGDLIVGQVLGAHVLVDAGGRKDLPGAGTADAVDVGQRDLHALVAREIHAHWTCHQAVFLLRRAEVWSQSVPALPTRPWPRSQNCRHARGPASVPDVHGRLTGASAATARHP